MLSRPSRRLEVGAIGHDYRDLVSVSASARAMRGLVLLLAVSACTPVGDERGEDAYPADPSTAQLGPPPQFSAEYKAPFQPFTQCVIRDLSPHRTIKPAYDEAAQLAQLAAYEIGRHRRFLYELALLQRPDGVVLAELRVREVSKLNNWAGEVKRTLEFCEKKIEKEV